LARAGGVGRGAALSAGARNRAARSCNWASGSTCGAGIGDCELAVWLTAGTGSSPAGSVSRLGVIVQTTTAAAAVVSGISHRSEEIPQADRSTAGGGAVFAMTASSVWQRAQLAACASAVARSCAPSASSAHAASVSASRQTPSGAGAACASSVSASRRPADESRSSQAFFTSPFII
jgi:hypothetical protein